MIFLPDDLTRLTDIRLAMLDYQLTAELKRCIDRLRKRDARFDTVLKQSEIVDLETERRERAMLLRLAENYP